jgi:tetratricopeptide (TPR) repeat protein
MGYEASTIEFQGDRLLAVAISYATDKQFTQAEAVYQRFLRDHPTNVRALRGLGSCYWDQRRPDEATAYLRKAWLLGDIDSLVPLGACYLASRQYDQMERLVPALLNLREGNSDVVACLLAYALTADPPKEDLLLRAIEGLPDKEVLLRDDIAQLLATAVERLRGISETDAAAQVILRKIIRGYECDKQTWPKVRLCAVADAHFFLGERSKAGEIYKQVLRDQPANLDALLGLGVVALYETNYTTAITDCRKAWSLGNKRALSPLAIAYLMAHDVEGMQDLLPSMLNRKAEDMQIVNSLVSYALLKSPKDRELFFKAIEDVDDGQILRRQDTTEAVVAGLKLFRGDQRAQRLIKLKQQQDKGVRS